MLVPAPENIFAGVPDPATPPVSAEEIEELDLNDEQKQILAVMMDGATRAKPWQELGLDSRAAGLSIMRMELKGLIARPRGIYRITKYGLDVARSLKLEPPDESELAGDEVF